MSKPTVADDTAELIAQIKALAIVRGSVVLASGRTADYYVDMRRVTLDGAVAPIIGRVMRALVADWEFVPVGGSTPSWSASRARRTACSNGSRDHQWQVAEFLPLRTPVRPVARF